MLVQKKFDALLNLLQAGLEKNPADQSLRLEYIDTLALAGEREKAAGEMLQLIVSIQESQAKAAPDKPPHIPSWMFEYLDNLKKK
jgi:protein involved in temperature-dependent protein secretion